MHRSSGSSPAWWTSLSEALHPQPIGPRQHVVGRGGPGDQRVLRVEEVEGQRGALQKEGERGRAHSWLGEEEGRASRDGTEQKRSGGHWRRRWKAAPWQSRRQSGLRGWLGGEVEGREGYSTLGWWRAARW